jgi:hypothetical protein
MTLRFDERFLGSSRDEGYGSTGVDPARDLFGRRRREIIAGDIRKAARLEFVLERRGSASAPFTMASARPIASARASSLRL